MREKPPRIRRLSIHLAFGALLAWAAAQAAAQALPQAPGAPAADQDVGELTALARAEAVQHLPALSPHERLSVGPIQPGLKLARCGDGRVQAGLAPGLKVSGRVLIELRCTGEKPWHLYVPVRITGTAPVVIAAHAIVAGTVLTNKDLLVEERDVIALPPGYLNSPEIALGLTAGRAIAGGAVLTNQQLQGTAAVQRGQSVTLVAGNGDVRVRMAGRALSDGLLNQRIRVENLSSGKVVEGIARSSQVVEIVFQ